MYEYNIRIYIDIEYFQQNKHLKELIQNTITE